MIDINKLKANPKNIISQLNKRGQDFSYLHNVLKLNKERIAIIQLGEKKKAFRNKKSKEIGQAKLLGKDISSYLKEIDNLKLEISKLDKKQKEIEFQITNTLLKTPNVPHETLPIKEDTIIKEKGAKQSFAFKPLDHATLATNLDIIDFKKAAKITGARFAIYKGKGAKLHRALSQYLLDKAINEYKFQEYITPYMVNYQSMQNTGQLPKFETDLFKVNNGYYLIPTAEVSITNLHAQEVIDVSKPLKYVSYSPCFRAEAGSAGIDIKGVIRQHQFHKVEIVMFSHPQHSQTNLTKMISYVENLLQELKLPYIIKKLCCEDLGFAAQETHDLEVWFPSQKVYKEISSCSNFGSFQARRANIKYKINDKLAHIHTLNGSALPIGRTIAAIIENYQQPDGSIKVPDVLVPYTKFKFIK